MGLLSGLGDLGLGKIENADIFEEKKQETAEAGKPVEKPFDEGEWLFDKTTTCPVCDNEFTNRTLKTGKARLIGQDPDLRPRYEKMDPLKYDVVVCPSCGYAGVGAFFTKITPPQAKLVKANISGKVHGVKHSGIFDYDDAIKRYQLALASAIVKKGKDSEKAYTCLKMAWCIRGKKETYDVNAADYEDVMAQCRADENEALMTAFDGFVKARQSENFPIAGMDEIALDYLLAELASRFGKTDVASKLISGILGNTKASSRMKDKARDLKERVQAEIRMKNGEM